MTDAVLYILRCADATYYVGSTTDLELRLAQHHDGIGSEYTAERRPVELVYREDFPTIRDAFEREQQVKGWRREKKEALIRGDWEALRALSRNSGQKAGP